MLFEILIFRTIRTISIEIASFSKIFKYMVFHSFNISTILDQKFWLQLTFLGTSYHAPDIVCQVHGNLLLNSKNFTLLLEELKKTMLVTLLDPLLQNL